MLQGFATTKPSLAPSAITGNQRQSEPLLLQLGVGVSGHEKDRRDFLETGFTPRLTVPGAAERRHLMVDRRVVALPSGPKTT